MSYHHLDIDKTEYVLYGEVQPGYQTHRGRVNEVTKGAMTTTLKFDDGTEETKHSFSSIEVVK